MSAQKNSRLHPLFILFVLFYACTSADKLKIESTNFDQQIDPFQNLEFNFSQNVIPDSLVEKWDTNHYFAFNPAVPGRYKWTGPDKLVFIPEVPFAPNTDYTTTLNKDVSRLVKNKFKIPETQLLFHTPYLTVERTNAYWGLSEIDKTQIQLRLNVVFNYPVSSYNVREFLDVNIKGEAKSYVIGETSDPNTIEIAIPSMAGDLQGEMSVVIKKGMKCIGSDRPLAGDEMFNLPVPPRDQLQISDVSAEFEEGQGFIMVFTSQPVEEQNIRQVVKINPEVDISIQTRGNGFKITGGFAEGQAYDLTISGKLKGIFGPTLGGDFRQTVSFGALLPYISFSDQNSLYLTPQGSRNLGINIINVPKIRITVFKIFENNVQHYLRNGKSWDWHYEDDAYYDSYSYSLDENYGKQISSREIDMRALPKKGNLRLLNMKPEELELSSDMKGIYLIRAESVEKSWLKDVQLVSVSDIGLIAKQGADEVFVAARSIATSLPMEGVNIKFYSRSNQVIYQAKTGADGVLIFKDIKKTAPGFDISMISARKNEDFNVLLYERSVVETSRFDAGGKRTAGLNYDVFIYGDRKLYRPGDSVFCNAIVRNFSWETIRDIPLKFRVITPDGKDFLVRRAQLNENGAAQLEFALPASGLTGSYVIEVLSGNDVMLGNYRISVEEFMPDRIKVDVKPNKISFLPGEKLSLNLSARNLFGPPAANRKTENELRIGRKNFVPKKFNDFNFFINTSSEITFENQVTQGVTDANGALIQEFTLPVFENIGLLDAKVYTTVFDETGRPVNRFTQVEIATQKEMFGIKNLPGWVNTNRPLSVSVIAIDQKERTVSAQARIEIVQIKWETVLERNYGNISYRSQKKENLALSRDVSVSPSGYNFQFTPPASGEYEVRVSRQGSANYVSSGFYAYGWSDFGSSAFFVNREGEVGIETDKPDYQPGDEAKLLFKTPFEGELLVTVEQNRVLEYYSLKVDVSGANMKLKITDKHLPNIYISATLIRKNDQSGLPLTVGHGYLNIKVDNPGLKLPVSILAPEKIRSKTHQTIRIKTAPGAEVTLAVVDEGILQITSYPTPSPYDWFYGKRALEVSSYDLFDEIFPELGSQRSSSGGDAAFDLGSRLNPLTSKRVKLISIWSGIKKANSSGEVSFTAAIPAFSGAVRIMATAYKGKQFGSSDKEMKVADPLVISSSLPRFLSPGDVAEVTVTLTNTTAKPLSANLKINTSGPVSAGSPEKSSIQVPANSEIQTSYALTAGNTTGGAIITVAVSAVGEKFAEETVLAVRPASTLEKTSVAGTLKAGEKITLTSDGVFLDGTSKSSLLLTQSPAGRYARDLGQLVNYPHGCLEQTISAAFPQIYFPDLAKMLKQENTARINTSENINAAILKISSLQQYNGGLVMWPSGGEADWWTTAYAANFLFEAEKAGYAVNQMVLDNILRYLTEKIKQKSSTEYFYKAEGDNAWQKKVQAHREIFYSLYVLALNGKPHLPTMNYYKARSTELTTDSRYMLACTYALLGDSRSFESLLPAGADSKEEPMAMTGGSYSSPVRDKAIALYTLLNADPTHPRVAILARQLGEMINGKQRLSTQEQAFSLLALGKLAGQTSNGKVTAEVMIAGKKTATFTGEDLITNLTGQTANISTSGTGNLFYYFETQGIPATNTRREQDNILAVRRKFLDRNGRVLTRNEFRQNELIVAEISISTTDNSVVDNVVITDMLPACFEVENTRLTSERELEWTKNRSVPDHIDFRDDRVNLFTQANWQTKKFYYLIRVVGKGNYKLGPAGAEAMYNGSYYSYSGAGMVSVK